MYYAFLYFAFYGKTVSWSPGIHISSYIDMMDAIHTYIREYVPQSNCSRATLTHMSRNSYKQCSCFTAWISLSHKNRSSFFYSSNVLYRFIYALASSRPIKLQAIWYSYNSGSKIHVGFKVCRDKYSVCLIYLNNKKLN